MSIKQSYRMPDGTGTKDASKYIEAFRSLMAPIAKITGSGRYGYDPNCTFQWRNQLVDIPADFVQQINDVLQAETARRLEAEKTIDMLCDDRIDVLDADLEAKAYRAKYPK